MCYAFFLVSSCVRAVTRSFYGSLLLLMFCKINSILPRTHLACFLSLLNPLNTLVSPLPQLDMRLSRGYNFIILSPFMLIWSWCQFLRIERAISIILSKPFHINEEAVKIKVPVVNLCWGYVRSWKLVLAKIWLEAKSNCEPCSLDWHCWRD